MHVTLHYIFLPLLELAYTARSWVLNLITTVAHPMYYSGNATLHNNNYEPCVQYFRVWNRFGRDRLHIIAIQKTN